MLLVPAKRRVMSPVLPLPLGTMLLSVQVLPPLVETKIGAVLTAPVGLTVNAEPAICAGFAGFTERFGSLSWRVSLLWALGIMLMTVTCARTGIARPVSVRRRSAAFHFSFFMASPSFQ